jgi:periodic tryptophan protein 1
LDMEHYDDDEGPDSGLQLFGNGGLGAAYYATNEDDPYLISKEDEDEDEIEDMTIKPADLLLLTARTEDDVSHLEVWIYEDSKPGPDGGSNMYVHHDIMLAAFPLALAWMDCGPGEREKGNFVAVATMHPGIEIWDLDVIDAVEPVATLGGPESPISAEEQEVKTKKSKKKKKKEENKMKEGSHVDAVLALAWNEQFRNVMASGGADMTVKIWDVNTLQCQHTVQCHGDKVQAVAWNKKQPTVLISGSFDGTVAMMDGRAPEGKAVWWAVSADVESLAWDPHNEHSFVVSLEDGTVRGHDIRIGSLTTRPNKGSESKAVYTIHAHEKAVCSISYSLVAPNLLATGSMDKTVKLWDLTNNQPTCIGSENPKVGAVFSTSFCKDLPFLLAVGGSKGNLHVWNTLENAEVAQRFQGFASR